MESTSQINSNLQIIKPKPNPIPGGIVNLSYQGNGDNLVEIKIEGNNSGDIFTLTAFTNVNLLDSNTIKIINLNDFQFRLQEAANNNSLINISYEDDQIFLLEIILPKFGFASAGIPSRGSNGSGSGLQ
ncbi:MAG: hypothetical protein WBM44_07400 [Waterburya sp.]